LGVLDVEINGKHVFEITEEGLRRLARAPHLGFDVSHSRTGLNSACLFHWFWALVECALKMAKGVSVWEFEVAEHGFIFTMRRSGDTILVTMSEGSGSPAPHYLTPFLVNRIRGERVPLGELVEETSTKARSFLDDLLDINRHLAEHPEFASVEAYLASLTELSNSINS
jgi:hypothetical protein